MPYEQQMRFEHFGIDPETAKAYLEIGIGSDHAPEIAFLDVAWGLREPSGIGSSDSMYVTAHLDEIIGALCPSDDDLSALGRHLSQEEYWSPKSLVNETTRLMNYTRQKHNVSFTDIAKMESHLETSTNFMSEALTTGVLNMLENSPYSGDEKHQHAAAWADSCKIIEIRKLKYCVPRASPDVARSAPPQSTDIIKSFDEILVRSEVAYLASGDDEEASIAAVRKIATMKIDFTPLMRLDAKAGLRQDNFRGFNDDLIGLAADAYKADKFEPFMALVNSGAHRAQLEAFLDTSMSAALSEGAL